MNGSRGANGNKGKDGNHPILTKDIAVVNGVLIGDTVSQCPKLRFKVSLTRPDDKYPSFIYEKHENGKTKRGKERVIFKLQSVLVMT